jgi:hypothetical protein
MSQESFAQQNQISVATLYRWHKKYGQMDEVDANRLKALEKENTEAKKMYAEAMLGVGCEKTAVTVEHRENGCSWQGLNQMALGDVLCAISSSLFRKMRAMRHHVSTGEKLADLDAPMQEIVEEEQERSEDELHPQAPRLG